jgi:hypothetical protein
MNQSTPRAFALTAVALPVLLLSSTVAARAEVNDCTAINAVPATIAAPGVYCFTGNHVLASAGVAIHILGVKDVVLDLNGHSVTGPATGTAVLVEDASRVTVRNGSIVSFGRAVYVTSNSFNTTVEDLRVFATGSQPTVESQGWGDIIQRNWIERGNPVIRTSGGASRVSDNDIFNATSGIDMTGSPAFVEDNRVTRTGAPSGYGVRTTGSRTVLSRNNVGGFATCFDMSAATRYRENVTISCTTTYTGGVSAGSNY